MDASCAGISLISTSVPAYNLMRLYAHIELSGKERRCCEERYLRGAELLVDGHSISTIRRLSLRFFVLYLAANAHDNVAKFFDISYRSD